VEPVTNTTSPDMACGRGASKVNKTATATPGSYMKFVWRGRDDYQRWPYKVGPVLTYLASCGKSCPDFDHSQAQWFKIAEYGIKSDEKWVQEDASSGISVIIPSKLKAGPYLVRHEIINLERASELGQAEFYMSCAQIEVTGSETGIAEPNEMVSFPGAYNATDPGIYITHPSHLERSHYQFPGPYLA
ncbi:lytic polysaccharide monooxygenase, partial [Amanita thiersii Skay4041]